MRSTGFVRKVDELGRVVIPKELRRTLDIDIKDPMEIYVDAEKIIFEKYKLGSQCIVTGEISDQNLSLANGKIILSPQSAQDLLTKLEVYLQKEGDV
ncbi:AbrB/MazE/SpoVT family DNA-binding domain-containing protein [Shouchella miscanthi]|uniref:AbrB/MazE/SpoVT family DNA-binding domain-containing protein n=1 Tax=Shouchella miscanthi TaxID=2598861 RepID=A0ABU6NJX5_9BACI|nr:AbrB/MazE/SpoVT family DNA-binding domain-containing protein [Shouchella miscanthi]